MKTFVADIFPKIQRFSQKLDHLTNLTNQHWVAIDNTISYKTVFIFRSRGELLVSSNGKVEKAHWEYLGNQSLLIERPDVSYLFKQGFIDETILALKVDGSEQYAVFVNENKQREDLTSLENIIEFLRKKYSSIPSQTFNNIKTSETISLQAKVEKYFKELTPQERDLLIAVMFFCAVVIAGLLSGAFK